VGLIQASRACGEQPARPRAVALSVEIAAVLRRRGAVVVGVAAVCRRRARTAARAAVAVAHRAERTTLVYRVGIGCDRGAGSFVAADIAGLAGAGTTAAAAEAVDAARRRAIRAGAARAGVALVAEDVRRLELGIASVGGGSRRRIAELGRVAEDRRAVGNRSARYVDREQLSGRK